MVTGIHIEFDITPGKCWQGHQIRFQEWEKQIIHQEIGMLLEKQAIEPTEHEDNEVISSIFIRAKKDGTKFRTILNLKELNKNVTYHHFKMDSLYTALRLVTKGCFMTSLDLTDAYYSVGVHEDHRKYLALT